MRKSGLYQPASDSTANVKPEDFVNPDTAGETNLQQSKHITSQVKEEEKCPAPMNLCNSTAAIQGPQKRGRGRPPKKRKLLIDKMNQGSADQDALKHNKDSNVVPCIASIAPVPACLGNHNSDDVPDTTDTPTISDPLHNDTSGTREEGKPDNSKPEDNVSALPKKRRGRKKKVQCTDLKEEVANVGSARSPAANAPVDNAGGPSRRLRSRGEHHLSKSEEKTDLAEKVDLKPNYIIPTVPATSKNKSNSQGIKRGRPKLADQQIPAKVSRLDVHREALSERSSDAGCAEKVEAEEQVKLDADKREAGGDEERDHLVPEAGVAQEQQSQLKEEVLPQGKLHSQAAASPTSEVTPLQDSNSPSLVHPVGNIDIKTKLSQDTNCSEELKSQSSIDSQENIIIPDKTDSCGTDVAPSCKIEPPPKPVGILPAIKEEDVEKELDDFARISELNSNASVQCSAEPTVKVRNPPRRKRGRRRRRKALFSAEHPEECGEEANSNEYTKKKGLLRCDYCGRTFKYLSQFTIHQRIHTGERPFKCPECDKAFTKNSNLTLHLKVHRKNSGYQKCPHCKVNFSSRGFPSHMKIHLDEMNQASEQKSESVYQPKSEALETPVSPVKKENKVCQYCGKTFAFRSALIRHVRVHTGEKPYKCDICGKAFGQAYFLRVHELTHWSVKRYNCTTCKKSFTHYSNARNHTCRVSGKCEDGQTNRRVKASLTYTCHICKNIFDNLYEFNSHMKAHTGAKLYRCLFCDKLFGVLSEFNAHHSACSQTRGDSKISAEDNMTLIQYAVPQYTERPGRRAFVKCELQNKSRDTSEQSPPTHQRKRSADLKKPFQSTKPALSHLVSTLNKLDNRSDPRKYLCPSCGRLFRHMGRLRAHMLTHARGQSYTCSCCGKTLENWKKLWHHQRVHRQRHGRFTCPQCGRGFRFVEAYKRHMTEHPEFQWIEQKPKKVFLPYQCEQCRANFKTLDLLFSHQLCHSSDTHKDSDFDLSIDDHSIQAVNRINLIAPSAPERNVTTVSPLAVGNTLEQVPPESQKTPVISFDLTQDLCKSVQHPSNTQRIQDGDTMHDGIEEHASRKPITPLRSAKRHKEQQGSRSNECEAVTGSTKCAICGDTYSAISDLYQHYLEHARGQV